MVGRYANSACQGGNYKFAWNYIINNGGVDKARNYRYKPKVKNAKDNRSLTFSYVSEHTLFWALLLVQKILKEILMFLIIIV